MTREGEGEGDSEYLNIRVSAMYYVVLGLSHVLLLDGEAQRARSGQRPQSSGDELRGRAGQASQINVIDRDRVTGARATGDWLLMVTGHR